MAEVVLFHHAHGLTSGLLSFAEELRAAGHVVHTPDLFEGRVFGTLEEGLTYAEKVGFGAVRDRGIADAERLPNEVVYAGFSLGVIPAQQLAQTRAGAKGALLFHSCVPPEECGGPWPEGVPAQIHIAEEDQFALEGDLDAARELAESVAGVELFLYPGDGHLFADPGLADYDQDAATLLKERTLEFLAKLG